MPYLTKDLWMLDMTKKQATEKDGYELLVVVHILSLHILFLLLILLGIIIIVIIIIGIGIVGKACRPYSKMYLLLYKKGLI